VKVVVKVQERMVRVSVIQWMVLMYYIIKIAKIILSYAALPVAVTKQIQSDEEHKKSKQK
jgi:dipeptide/tripeptide permease